MSRKMSVFVRTISITALLFIAASCGEESDDKSERLLEAAKNGDIGEVKWVVARGADVNAKDEEANGKTALILALENGHTDIAKFLIENGADVNAKSNGGRTALMPAIRYLHTDIAKLLIENGADVSAKSNGGWTAVIYAADDRHTDILEILIEKGAEVNVQTSYGYTPLIMAAKSGEVDPAMLLIENGASVNVKEHGGYTPLMGAVLKNKPRMVKLLTQKGADVNAKDDFGRTALMHAAKKGHYDVAKLLIEAGADVNAKNNEGLTAIDMAKKEGHSKVVKRLESPFFRTSFKCTGELNRMEKAVCTNYALAAADRELGALYKEVRWLLIDAGRKALRKEQLKWLKDLDSIQLDGGYDEAILNNYEERIAVLRSKKEGVVPDAEAYAEPLGYVPLSDEQFVIDTGTDEVVRSGADDRYEKHYGGRYIFDGAYFYGGNVIVVMTEYDLIAIDAKTFDVKKVLIENSQFENIFFGASPDGKKLYVSWVPYDDMWVDEKYRVTVFDENLEPVKTIEGLRLDRTFDFSPDGGKIYIARYYEEVIEILDAETGKVLEKMVSPIDELAKKGYEKTWVIDLKGQKVIVGGKMETKDGPERAYFVFDIVTKELSKALGLFEGYGGYCKLAPNGALVVCDEQIKPKSMRYTLGKLHIYDVNQAKEVGVVDLGIEGDSTNERILAISPDSKKLYYNAYDKPGDGLKVVSLESYMVIKTIPDVAGGTMTFSPWPKDTTP